MKLTLPWLKEHLETDASAEAIAEALTALGLEVEGLEDPAGPLDGFVVGYVREARPHPYADRLRLCTVDTGDGVREVVCGAPNARAGMKGVFAREGLVIPQSGEVLRRAEIRGVVSQGMLCSARELNLGTEHDGIIELPDEAEIGAPAAAALGLEGPVLDVAVTPDRADCLSVRGIARDLAAAGIGRLRPLRIEPVAPQGPPGPAVRLDFTAETASACPMFVARLIRGVRNGPSPAWLQRRLRSIGLRPISALVDITNYVTIDLGRPLHVFDAAKLAGDLVVRLAHPGERLRALDGKEYELAPSMTVIADSSGAVSLGGIMGGESTGVTEVTTDVVLEVALFDAVRTGVTGRTLGIESDARQRFERGLDPAFVLPGAEHATKLIVELCGGAPAPVVVAGREPPGPRPVAFRTAALPKLAGLTLPVDEIQRILGALGFALERGAEAWIVTPPSWRHDVYTEACIVEELARIHGFDRIPPVSVRRDAAVGGTVLTFEQRRRAQIRRTLAAQGLYEAVTWSFMAEELAVRFGARAPVRLANPISADLGALRPSILPNLLLAAARNVARGETSGGLFEVGPRFTGTMPGEQVVAAAGLRFGAAMARGWDAPARPVDAYDAKADALAALATAGIKLEQLQATADAPAWYHPGRSGVLRLGPQVLASFGELHPAIRKAVDIDQPVVGFELDVDALPRPRSRLGKTRPPLESWPYPPIDRDLAFVVDESVTAEALLKAIRNAEKKLLREVTLFDVYRGPGLPDGKKSLAVAIRLQSRERTLTEAEAEPIVRRMVEAAAKAVGAKLRQ
jgi:phenylalanyl-tRNA synthetase beta chain